MLTAKEMASITCGEDINGGGVNSIHRQSASEIQEVNRSEQIVTVRCRKRTWPCRSIGSSSILLIFIWEFIISFSVGFSLYNLQYSTERMDREKEEGSISYSMWSEIILIFIIAISSPITSLLAEVIIGRYKLASHSLKAMWLLSLIASIISLCLPVTKSSLYITSLVVLLEAAVMNGFFATAIPLGIDQINGGLNANISSFIQWFLWAFCSGLAISSVVVSVVHKYTYLMTSQINMIMSLLPVLLLSVGLILDFCFHHKLVKEPVTVNPVSLIFKILKYAAKHKYPVQRSAFTYCENEQPTRLDYGKSKYGGPFTTEQVEDVKTFWRVLLVLLVFSTLGFSLIASGSRACLIPFQTSSWYGIQPLSVMMVCVPLYELLIYPCLRNRGPSIIKSIGIGAAAVLLTSLYGVMTEITRQLITSESNECMFTHTVDDMSEIIPFSILTGLSNLIVFKSTTEFICAQAPYNMNGVLVGLLLTVYDIFVALGILLYFVWSSKWFDGLDTSTCGIWFYLTTLVLAVMSSALLGLVIRWYKARERDELTTSHNLVEEVYHKYQVQASQK